MHVNIKQYFIIIITTYKDITVKNLLFSPCTCYTLCTCSDTNLLLVYYSAASRLSFIAQLYPTFMSYG